MANEQLPGQIDIFDWLSDITGKPVNALNIDKPIRLIELFSGVGSQAMAIRDLGGDFESWRTCEWEVNAIASYKAIHCKDDNTDYSKGLSKDELVEILFKLGISSDGKEPMAKSKIQRKGEPWLRQTYNNIKATRNMVDITQVKGGDLGITERHKYTYLLTYSFPCQ